MSPTKRPCPVRKRRSSLRVAGCPMPKRMTVSCYAAPPDGSRIVTHASTGRWMILVRPSRRPLRGPLRMTYFLNAIKILRHPEERPAGASRRTDGAHAAPSVCSDRRASSIVAPMNDVTEAVRAKPAIVRPRDAASLILLRGEGRALELLAGRRPGHVRFMPGVYVFPGGAIDPEDRRKWRVEAGGEHLPPRLVHCARAALRETWEEVGVVVGRRDGAAAPTAHGLTPIEAAYAGRGIT